MTSAQIRGQKRLPRILVAAALAAGVAIATSPAAASDEFPQELGARLELAASSQEACRANVGEVELG